MEGGKDAHCGAIVPWRSLLSPGPLPSLSPAILPVASLRCYHHLSWCVSRDRSNDPHRVHTQAPREAEARLIRCGRPGGGSGEHMVTADAAGLILRVRRAKNSARHSDVDRARLRPRPPTGVRPWLDTPPSASPKPVSWLRTPIAPRLKGMSLASTRRTPSASFCSRARAYAPSRRSTSSRQAAQPNKSAKSDAIRERALHVHFAPLHARDVASDHRRRYCRDFASSLLPKPRSKAHTALRAVFDYATVVLEPHDVRFNNPADKRLLRHLGWTPKSRSENKPHPAVDWRIMPSVVGELSQHGRGRRGLRHPYDRDGQCALKPRVSPSGPTSILKPAHGRRRSPI